MNVRQLIIGFGLVMVGVADIVAFRGLTQVVGDVAVLVGAGTIVWGLFADPPEDPIRESMPASLPGRLCDHCGKMTSLDSSTCQNCGALLDDTGTFFEPAAPPRP